MQSRSSASSPPSPPDVAEPPLYYSRFGGLWTDRRDAQEQLARRRAEGLDEETAARIATFVERGYVVIEGAVPPSLCDEYRAFFEAAWRSPPPTLFAHWRRRVVPLSMEIYDEVAKVSDVHYLFPRAAELLFPPAVLRFLTAIYERPPVAFQTMTMRKGSEEELHTDTGPLTLTEPCALTASWLALEDVNPRSGALQYVPGSHHVEVLVNGVSKAHHGDYPAYGRALEEQKRRCRERGLPTERFLARRGDVLVWAADLLHGGAPIEDRRLTRTSLVTHFMPHGAMPTFYDFSGVNYVPYPTGGYRLDRMDHANAAPPPPVNPLAALRQRIEALPVVGRAARIGRVVLDELRRG